MLTSEGRKLNVLLIYPRFQYPSSNGIAEPLGILYIASYLRNEGHHVEFADLTFESDLSALDPYLENKDFVAMSSSSPLFGKARVVTEYIRAKKPGLPLVLGGPHATLEMEDSIAGGFDIGFYGEADLPILEFVRRFPDGDWKSVRGMFYQDNGEIIRNPEGDRIENLDEVPFPARDLIDYKKYFERGLDDFGMISSRGCPAKCTFCWPTLDVLFKNLRIRSAENVAEELHGIVKQFGNSFPFMFKDDMMTRNGTEFFETLVTEFQARNMNISWWCNSRVDDINYSLLRLMKKSGCQRVNFGVESGSQKILNFYRKGTTPDQIKKAFKLCHQVGIWPVSNVMIGAPPETKEDLDMTVALLNEIKPVGIPLYFTTAMPGKAITDWAKKNDKLRFDVTYEDYDTAMNREKVSTNLILDHLTQDDLFEYKARIMSVRDKYIRRKAIRVLAKRILSGRYPLQILRNPIGFLRGVRRFAGEQRIGFGYLFETVRSPRARLAHLLDGLIGEIQKLEWTIHFQVQFHPDS